jgi:hypothetical protein
MHKSYRFLALLSFGFLSFACPTRPIDRPDGASGGQTASAGTDGSAGTGPGGKAGAAGGAAGSAGASAAAGVSGTAGGGGAAGEGSAAAGAGGGVAGSAGQAGGGGGAAGIGAGGHDAGGTAGGANGGAAGASSAAGAPGTAGTGGCASACGPTQTCVGSTCLLTDGQQCSLKSQCASNVCTPFWQDIDGDGYGAGAAVGFCGTSAPIGYAPQSGDCCDSAPNLAIANLIHPNADFQPTSAGGVCGIKWDYNCDGTIETSFSAGQCDPGATYPTCTPQFINHPESDCGTVQPDFTCIGETVPNSIGPGTMNVCAGSSKGPEAPLGCR